MKNFSLTLLFLILVIKGNCGGIIKDSTTQHIVNKKFNFAIDIPINWSNEQNLVSENQIIFKGPIIDSGNFKNDGSFGLDYSILKTKTTTLQAFHQNMYSFSSNKMFENFTIKDKGTIKINGENFEYVIHTLKYNNITMCSLQFYLVKNNKLYILGGSIPAENMGKYEKIYFDIAKSFKVLPIK